MRNLAISQNTLPAVSSHHTDALGRRICTTITYSRLSLVIIPAKLPFVRHAHC